MQTVSTAGGGGDPGEPSEDSVYGLLAAARRRAVLRCLEREGGEARLADLTERVALEEGIPAEASSKERKKVYVSLYQTHVPALAADGVVEYDPDAKVVRLTPRASPLLDHLHLRRERPPGGLFTRLFRAASTG